MTVLADGYDRTRRRVVELRRGDGYASDDGVDGGKGESSMTVSRCSARSNGAGSNPRSPVRVAKCMDPRSKE